MLVYVLKKQNNDNNQLSEKYIFQKRKLNVFFSHKVFECRHNKSLL